MEYVVELFGRGDFVGSSSIGEGLGAHNQRLHFVPSTPLAIADHSHRNSLAALKSQVRPVHAGRACE